MSAYLGDMLSNIVEEKTSNPGDVAILIALIVAMIVLATCICTMYNAATAQYAATPVPQNLIDAVADDQRAFDAARAALQTTMNGYSQKYTALADDINSIPAIIAVAQAAITVPTTTTGDTAIAIGCFTDTTICIDNLWKMIVTLQPFYDAAQAGKINMVYGLYNNFVHILPNINIVLNSIDPDTDDVIGTSCATCVLPDISTYTTLASYSELLTNITNIGSATTASGSDTPTYYTVNRIYSYFDTCYTGWRPYISQLQTDANALSVAAGTSISAIASNYTKTTKPTIDTVNGYFNTIAALANAVATLSTAITVNTTTVDGFTKAYSGVCTAYTNAINDINSANALDKIARIDSTRATASYTKVYVYYSTAFRVRSSSITSKSATTNSAAVSATATIKAADTAAAGVTTIIITDVMTNIIGYYTQLVGAYNYAVAARVPWIISNLDATDTECAAIVQAQSAINNIMRLVGALLSNPSTANMHDIVKLSYITTMHETVMITVYNDIINIRQLSYDTYDKCSTYYTTSTNTYTYTTKSRLVAVVAQFKSMGALCVALLSDINACDTGYTTWYNADVAHTAAIGSLNASQADLDAAVTVSQQNISNSSRAKASIANTVSIAVLITIIPYIAYVIMLLHRKSVDT